MARKHGCLRGTILFVLLAIVIGIIAGSLGGRGPTAKYRVSEVSVQPTDSAEVTVSWWVENVGKGSGTPVCQIIASTPGGAGSGFDTATLNHALSPGEASHGSDTFTITNNLAAEVQVSGVSVKCS